MRRLKYLISTVATLALAGIVGLGFGAVSASAAETNKTYDKAVAFSSTNPAQDCMDSEKDSNWFVTTVERNAGFKIKLTDTDGKTNTTWYMYVYDKNMDQVERFNMSSGNISLESYMMHYAVGDEVYVNITPFINSAGVNYQVEVIYDDTLTWAAEDNNLPSEACVLKAGDEVYGIISNSVKTADNDWYSYVAPADAMVSFTFDDIDKVQMEVGYQVLDGDEQKLKGGSFRGFDDGYLFETDKFEVKKGETLYVKLYNVSKAMGKTYKLGVSQELINPDDLGKIDVPYAAVAGTNIVVGKADNPGAKVFVSYKSKKYSAVADENGIYRVVTAKLAKNKKITIWQEFDGTASVKRTVKVTKK